MQRGRCTCLSRWRVGGRPVRNGLGRQHVETSWLTPGFSNTSVTDVSLALDSQGVPWVAFGDSGLNFQASVMKFTNGAWSYVGARGFTPARALGLQLALDKWGTPYVAYADDSIG